MEGRENTTAVQALAAVPLTASPRKDRRLASKLSRLASVSHPDKKTTGVTMQPQVALTEGVEKEETRNRPIAPVDGEQRRVPHLRVRQVS